MSQSSSQATNALMGRTAIHVMQSGVPPSVDTAILLIYTPGRRCSSIQIRSCRSWWGLQLGASIYGRPASPSLLLSGPSQ